jgi:hypothetical protein
MDHQRILRADCTRCAGLCCVSLPFDRSEWFAFDKAADVPCQNLLPTNTCAIHDGLAARGQAGCAHYDCYGAGQRVTQELFAGISWRTQPEIAAAMFAAFRSLKHVHELRLLLHEAIRLELTSEHLRRREELLLQLEPAEGFSADDLSAMSTDALAHAVYTLLYGLRNTVGVAKFRRRLPLAR